MKKLNKLQIDSSKIMKNQELVTLKGGYGGACCICIQEYYPYNIFPMAASGPMDCRESCKLAGMGYRWDC